MATGGEGTAGGEMSDERWTFLGCLCGCPYEGKSGDACPNCGRENRYERTGETNYMWRRAKWERAGAQRKDGDAG